MTEQSTIDHINEMSGTKLILVKDQFSDYDAEDSNYIVEIKNRRKYYPDKMIEASKLYKNERHAQIYGKKFLYVVTDPKGFYVYNVTNLMAQIVRLPMMALKCPKTTDFIKKDYLEKWSYILPETLSIQL